MLMWFVLAPEVVLSGVEQCACGTLPGVGGDGVLQSAGPSWLVALWHVLEGIFFGRKAVEDVFRPYAARLSLLVHRGVPLFHFLFVRQTFFVCLAKTPHVPNIMLKV